MRVTLRPTRAADLALVTSLPLPHRIKAITAVLGDVILGVGGIGYRPDGTVVAFAHICEQGRSYPRAIHRAGLAAMAMIRAAGVPLVVAEAQEGNPAAERWLLRLGFARCGSAFVWRR